MSTTENEEPPFITGSPSVELSANRTSLSFERTRMSADRTLMSIVRTSLSLISFGFTIFEAFRQLKNSGGLPAGGNAPAVMGISLVSLGIVLLTLGITSHMHFGKSLNSRRGRLYQWNLLHRDISYSVTPTFVIAFLLLAIGVVAVIFMVGRALL
jgi:putative membrane protein